MALQLCSYTLHFAGRNKFWATQTQAAATSRRRAFSLLTISTFLSFSTSNTASWSKPEVSDFVDVPNGGGVKALDLRIGDGAETPSSGDTVAIHYYGRLAAKQGWRFDSTYEHKDENGGPLPFEFVLGSGKVAFVGSLSLHHKDIRIRLKNPSHLTFLTDRDYSLLFSIQHVLPMVKAQPWGHSFSILS